MTLAYRCSKCGELLETSAADPLIAAAPDLLDALKKVVAISDRKHDAWDKARAAIAKAEGAELAQ